MAFRSADRKISFMRSWNAARIVFERDRGGAYVAWALLCLIVGLAGAYWWLLGSLFGLLLLVMALSGAVSLWLSSSVAQAVVVTPKSIVLSNLVRYTKPAPEDIFIDNAMRETTAEREVTVDEDAVPDEETKVERTGPSSWVVWIVRVLSRRTVVDRSSVTHSVDARAWMVYMRARGKDVRLFDRLYREEAEALAQLTQVALTST